MSSIIITRCLKLAARCLELGQGTRGVHAKRNPSNSPTFRRALDPRSIGVGLALLCHNGSGLKFDQVGV